MSQPEAADAFIDKWLQAEPWHRLLLLFEPASQRRLRCLVESLGYELRSAALDSSDARVGSAKLGWWLQEWQRLAQGLPSHPLTQALATAGTISASAEAGARWIAAAAALAEDTVDTDLDAARRRLATYCSSQHTATATLFSVADDDDAGAEGHALALLAERLPMAAKDLARGRLPVSLSVLAESGLTRSELGRDEAATAAVIAAQARALHGPLHAIVARLSCPYRRSQAALARLLVAGVARDGRAAWDGQHRLPPLRSVFAVWRARRMTFVTGP